MIKKKSSIGQYIDERGGLIAHGSIDFFFFVLVMVILIIGLAMLYSASYAYAYQYKDQESSYYFSRQLLFAGIGIVFMLILSKLNYKIFIDVGAHLGSVVSVLLLVIALFMPKINGTRRHIYIPGIGQFQPSDIAKFVLILTLAMWLDKYHDVIVSKKPLKSKFAKKINAFFNKPVLNQSLIIICICGAIIVCFVSLVALGSHLSGAVLMLIIGVIMLALGEVRGKWFFFGFIAVVLIFFVAYNAGILKDYMEERFYAFFHKDFEPYGARWQINNALYAIGSGGFFGKGIGKSTLKHLYVSEPQNDMIFSIVVEELGFFGASVIILIFALIVWRGVVIGVNSDSRYGALVSMGVVFQLAVQVILNIAVATDSIPNTGISLPFFSAGGTSIIMMLVEMGFVLSVSRSAKIKHR